MLYDHKCTPLQDFSLNRMDIDRILSLCEFSKFGNQPQVTSAYQRNIKKDLAQVKRDLFYPHATKATVRVQFHVSKVPHNKLKKNASDTNVPTPYHESKDIKVIVRK